MRPVEAWFDVQRNLQTKDAPKVSMIASFPGFSTPKGFALAAHEHNDGDPRQHLQSIPSGFSKVSQGGASKELGERRIHLELPKQEYVQQREQAVEKNCFSWCSRSDSPMRPVQSNVAPNGTSQ